MTKSDLPALRQLAKNGQIFYTPHCHQRMLERGYTTDDAKQLLESDTNQIIEVQSPSKTPGKEHLDERIVISDPAFNPAINVIICLDFSEPKAPEIILITIEEALDDTWDKNPNRDPWLVRKPKT